MIKNIAITKLAFFLTILCSLAVLTYQILGIWASLASVLLILILWVIYCYWEGRLKARRIEEYISYFVAKANKHEQKLLINGLFFFNREYCDGWVTIDSVGVYLRLNYPYSIPWQNIKGITLLTFNTIQAARLYLVKDGMEANKLAIPWDDSFVKNIPSDILFVDSRNKGK